MTADMTTMLPLGNTSEHALDYASLLARAPYDESVHQKSIWFADHLHQLDMWHLQACAEYARLQQISPSHSPAMPLSARLFKQLRLQSVPDEAVVKTLTSSGTSSQQVSRIALDAATAKRQQYVLSSIMRHWLGPTRLPMLIIDHPDVVRQRHGFSARAAGIQGMMLFGRHYCYALNEDMSVNIDVVAQFLQRFSHERIFIFGFTFMLWAHWLQQPDVQALCRRYALQDSVLLHGGGWKKLQAQAVSTAAFNARVNTVMGQVSTHNFYGMVEQTGTVYVACEAGHFHCPAWADIDIVSLPSLQPVPLRTSGVIQVSSLLATSYPGHRLLTEDIGEIVHHDDCPCGLPGKAFVVHGRLPKAEVRGCSDTFSNPQTVASSSQGMSS